MCIEQMRPSPPLLTRALSLLTLIGGAGCVERAPAPIAITEVSPAPLSPGEDATVIGRGFGDPLTLTAEQVVSIAGRPVTVRAWSDQRIEITLPAPLDGGERILTVSDAGRPLVSAPVYVAAPLTSGVAPDIGLPQLQDQGPRVDPERDMGPELDQGPPDEGPPLELQVDYSPLVEGAEVGLSPRLTTGEGGRLELRVDVTLSPERQTQTWGLATHLTYPPDRLQFLGLTQSADNRLNAVVSAQLAGRVMLYRVNPTETVMTLRFEVLDPIDRLTELEPLNMVFIPRFSGIRDLQKNPTSAVWSGGSLRYVSP